MKKLTKAWVLWAVTADGVQYEGIIDKLTPWNNRDRFSPSDMQKVPQLLKELMGDGLVYKDPNEKRFTVYKKIRRAAAILEEREHPSTDANDPQEVGP